MITVFWPLFIDIAAESLITHAIFNVYNVLFDEVI